MSELIVYLNGDFIPLNNAKIPVMDRGFMFGDGVYEAIAVFDGKLFGLEQHMKRLEHSLKSLFMKMPFNEDQFREIFNELLIKNEPQKNQLIYMQITRGVAPERAYVVNDNIAPTIFMMINPLRSKYREEGIKVILKEDIRWERCDIKSLNRVANILFSYQAKEAEVDDVIIKSNNKILEGASSNVFIVKDNVIYTPEQSNQLLKGITREIIIKIAGDHDISCYEQPISVEELFQADEVWLTSSSRNITPVIEVDSKRINDGKVGPMFQNMIHTFHEYMDQLK